MRHLHFGKLFFVVFSLLLACTVSARKPIKTLLITGQNNHNWQVSHVVLKQILENSGRFDVDFAISPEQGKDMSGFVLDFSPYQLVVLDYNGDSWPEETNRRFLEYVQNGGGVVIYHAADNAFSKWPEFTKEWHFVEDEAAVEMIKEAVRGIRNVRTGMNVPPSKKAKVFVVSESENVRNTFENGKVFFATLGSASEVTVQADRSGIDEDAVSAVLPEAVIYMPFAELVDIDKEIERLQKEEQRLTKELARVNGMLSNERFMSKAPESKVAEERAKLEKYSQMMDQVKERLTHLQAR